MKTYLDCIPCFMKQALRAGRVATSDEGKIKQLLDELGCMIKNIPLYATPPETADLIYQKIAETTGVADPYKDQKKAAILEALALYPQLKIKIESSPDPLLIAIKFAIAGNVIDLGVSSKYNLKNEIDKVLIQQPAIFHYEEFKATLKKANTILYLGDNAGESVFDRLLIEIMNKPVTYVVRDKAVINDVILQDAIDSGLNQVADIISSGSSAPGIIPDRCSREFLDCYTNADMVISKGQGNYEGLSETKRRVFFLLKAKCPVIAKNLSVNTGDIILSMNVGNH